MRKVINWLKYVFRRYTWGELLKLSNSPKDICFHVRCGMQFVPDAEGFDEHETGRDAWKRGYGDCEDFAACVRDACDDKGFIASMIILQESYGDHTAHAVVLGNVDGRRWVSSNGSFAWCKNREDCFRKVMRSMRWKSYYVMPRGTDLM